MILVTSHRFAIFYKKFGRIPGLDDELFFDETRPKPVRASQDEIKTNRAYSSKGEVAIKGAVLIRG
jgi:hypothetical protein